MAVALTRTAGTRPRHPGTALLLGGVFVLTAGVGVLFALLADLQEEFGLSTGSLGVVAGVAFVSSLVAQLTLAGQADRGRARVMLLGGMAVAIVALVWFAAARAFWELAAARALAGAAVGTYLPASRAVVARLDPDRVGENLGRLASAELGGFITGPVIGSVLADLAGLRAPFVVLAAVLAGGLAVMATRPLPAAAIAPAIAPGDAPAIAPGDAPGPSDAGARRRVPLDLLRVRGVRVAALYAVTFFLPVGVYEALWSRYLQDQGASSLFVGISLTLYGLPFVLVAPMGGRLADRVGSRRAIAVSLPIVLACTVGYGLLDPPMAIAGLALVEALGGGVATPAVQAAMVRACPPGRVAAGQGLAGALNQMAAAAIALVAASVYGAHGPAVLFVATGTVMAVLGVGALTLDRRPAPTVDRPT